MGSLSVAAVLLLAANAALAGAIDCAVACFGSCTAGNCVPCIFANASLCHYTTPALCHNIKGLPCVDVINTTAVRGQQPKANMSRNDTVVLTAVVVLVCRWRKRKTTTATTFSLVGSTRRPYQPALHDTLRSPTPEVWARKYSLFASAISKFPQSSNASYLDTVTTSSCADPWVFKEHDLGSSISSDLALSQSIVMMRDTATFTRDDDDVCDLTGVYAPETRP
uniref:Secreted protein n=1 Tax=Achlya hypogyna TaxID=1202772 RepID=A0A0A7CPI8_ACHHY|nr:secreted protein [Achlya hypogyna]